MAFKSPPPHRRSSGNLGTGKGGRPNKYQPHIGRKQTEKSAKRREANDGSPQNPA